MASWRTTAVAIMTALTVFLTAGIYALDYDPETQPDWEAVASQIQTLYWLIAGGGLLTAIGFWFTRDDKVSDRSAKAKLLIPVLLCIGLCGSTFAADPYDDLITISQQCKKEYVQTEQARVAEAAAEANLVETQRVRDIALRAYDQQAIDAELLRLSAELQEAVSHQNWAAFIRLMGELEATNKAREQAKAKFESAQAAVEAASAALTVAEQTYYRENEERLAALESLRDAIDTITRPR